MVKEGKEEGVAGEREKKKKEETERGKEERKKYTKYFYL